MNLMEIGKMWAAQRPARGCVGRAGGGREGQRRRWNFEARERTDGERVTSRFSGQTA